MANGKSPLELKRLAALQRERKKSQRIENEYGSTYVEELSRGRKFWVSARERRIQEQFTREVLEAKGMHDALAMRAGMIEHTPPMPLPKRQRVNLRRYHKNAIAAQPC